MFAWFLLLLCWRAVHVLAVDGSDDMPEGAFITDVAQGILMGVVGEMACEAAGAALKAAKNAAAWKAAGLSKMLGKRKQRETLTIL